MSDEFWLVYLDEVGDDGFEVDTNAGEMSHDRSTGYFGIASMAIKMLDWEDYLGHIHKFRNHLKNEYGINIRDELHAVDIDGQRGCCSYSRTGQVLRREDRFAILRETLEFIASTLDCLVITLWIDKLELARRYPPDTSLRDLSLDYQLNRYNVNWYKAEGTHHAVLVHDEGNAPSIRRAVRRLRSYNYISTRKGGFSKNIPLDSSSKTPCLRTPSTTGCFSWSISLPMP